jgi:carbonic anhydrase/acetyltransferase-like protein (isoleucine patch superfamily)
MENDLNKLIGGILEESPFLKSIAELSGGGRASRLFGDEVRPLRDHEVRALKEQGNVSDDWGLVLVTPGFTPRGIHHSSFYGPCRLGSFEAGLRGEGTPGLPPGIVRSTIVDSEIGHGCVIHNTGLVARCVVREGALLVGNGSVAASGSCSFGNGLDIAVGNETGGREIASYAELTVAVAEAVAKNRFDRELLARYREFVEQYVERCTAPWCYVGTGAVIRNTATVENSYVGDSVSIVGATLVRNSTLLGADEEKTEVSHGACIQDSCVQWGCEVTSMAIVTRSVLCEHSHVERHGKVAMSVIGPNTGVAEGEVTSCLLGPFVGFHHQSMLIAAIWPEGKGNVAYGANIGSNHTSKSPDQEIWCGEGMFFGLGVNVKFPSDFTRAPYSIIATGVDTLPQRLEFPFSLINKPVVQAPGVSPSFNELFPAWVLSNNIYAVRRNEGKYRKRNRARRSAFTFAVFRPEIIDLMLAARDALKKVGAAKDLYLEKDIPGLGKNFMTEQSRVAGIVSYDLFIEYYALMGLLQRLGDLQSRGEALNTEGFYARATDDLSWEHARAVLVAGKYAARNVGENLARCKEIVAAIADSTYRTKERDDERGSKIIPDYAQVTCLAGDDSFVKETMREAAVLTRRIEETMKLL